MDSGSKILIIDDERSGISDFSKALCVCLSSTEEEGKDRYDKWKAIDYQMPKPESGKSVSIKDRDEYYFNKFNDFWAGNAICPRSFEDAYRLVNAIGTGEEYNLIFIDRNLENYHDLKNGQEIQIDEKIFTKEFFQGINGFVGDYLFIMLKNSGVSLEKICFLTANNDASIEELKKSPYLHKKQLPEIIDKSENGYEELKIKLKYSHNAKIRFLYKDMFNNEKIQEIFGPYIENFIAVLSKRYKYGRNAKYDKGDGILLRNMIEAVVAYIVETYFGSNPKLQTCRDLLNAKDAKYNCYLVANKRKHLTAHWWRYIKETNTFPTDQLNVEQWLLRNVDYYKEPKNVEKASKDALSIINMTEQMKTWVTLIDFYKQQGNTSLLPHKYIFSYIDNIYTVTSELSAHGKNDKTTEGLSSDGWSALFSGMLQIMQWVAKENSESPLVTK
ncbi:MAG: hypothetical protein IJW08_03730 [Lentisphaeria bacterium]|nr:hypothetical protein [Lentisphaeria bacterium]